MDKYPSWVAAQRSAAFDKIASSSNDVKIFLRHVALPHVLSSYHKIVGEILPAATLAQNECSAQSQSQSQLQLQQGQEVQETALTISAASNTANTTSSSTLEMTFAYDTAPVCSGPGQPPNTSVDRFLRGLAEGRGGTLHIVMQTTTRLGASPRSESTPSHLHKYFNTCTNAHLCDVYVF
jgi:hypothetical protein